MRVILDDGPRRVFASPLKHIQAHDAIQLQRALVAVEDALARGHHVAGWFAYELGYALEPRLGLRASQPLLSLGVFGAPTTQAPQPVGRAYAGRLQNEWDATAYGIRFAQVKDLIAAGDIYQANLSFRARFAFLGDALDLYESLRGESQAGHCAFVDDGKQQILSLSPELFFDLNSQGAIEVRPMKGTLARLGDDETERSQLAQSAKDRAENLMIVDLIRNDLSRIAEKGSVEVKDLFKIETYPSFHAMVSTVRAIKRADVGVTDILRALFPCGSVTGAPKIRAMEILRILECSTRGAYCGAVGHFAPDGSARFNVAIRTLTINGDHGELGIGGGIVQDSRADGEYAECLLKAKFFETNRTPVILIETLRHEGDFVRLGAHLKRMQTSAKAFGIPCDLDKARDCLTKLITDKDQVLRVRLTLDEDGNFESSCVPLPPNPQYWSYRISDQRLKRGDMLLRHKTNWRALYDQDHPDCDELLFCNQEGELCEGARSNIFVPRGQILLTPPCEAGLLPGLLRAELIAQGRAREQRLTPEDLKGEIYLGNALRGLIKARPI